MVSIDNSRLVSNGNGVRANGRVIVSLRNSIVANNVNSGVLAIGSSTEISDMTIENCIIANNGQTNPSAAGVYASGAMSVIRLSNNVITNNSYGIRVVSSGNVLSFGNNRIHGNSIDGAPTGTIPMN